MISLSSLLFRARNSFRKSSNCDIENSDLEQVHRRLVNALSERDPVELAQLLADDVQLRFFESIHYGRPSVLLALESWLGQTRIRTAPTQLRKLTGDAVLITAQWLFDCPERGQYAVEISTLCVRREGVWQIIQLRQDRVTSS